MTLELRQPSLRCVAPSNPATVFALELLAQEQPHARPSGFPWFIELLESENADTTRGSKQAVRGGEFTSHGMNGGDGSGVRPG